MTMQRVLFVDDEPRLLDGLQGLLRKRRHEWEMVFAVGGETGWEHIDRGTFDVVVSDMRMPKIDGVALLDHARQVRPEAVRIVLSGYSDLEATLRLVPIAHQFLSKPCDGKTLEGVISRALSVKDLVPDPALRAKLGCIDRLPVAPGTLTSLARLLDEDAELDPIAKVIAGDIGLGAKLLQIVNSSFFGLAGPCVEIPEAISYLGLDILRHLAVTSDAFGPAIGGLNPPAGATAPLYVSGTTLAPGHWLGELSFRAARVGELARGQVQSEHQREALMSGFLSDVGILARAVVDQHGLRDDLAEAQQRSLSLAAVERERRVATHAAIGGYLLGIWGLPPSIVGAVAHHEDEVEPAEDASPIIRAAHRARREVQEPPNA